MHGNGVWEETYSGISHKYSKWRVRKSKRKHWEICHKYRRERQGLIEILIVTRKR